MVTLTLTDEQVIDLVKQLPPERKLEVLLTLAADTSGRREFRIRKAEEQLRRLAAERGRNWDGMSEDEREAFVDDLVHEDRECAR